MAGCDVVVAGTGADVDVALNPGAIDGLADTPLMVRLPDGRLAIAVIGSDKADGLIVLDAKTGAALAMADFDGRSQWGNGIGVVVLRDVPAGTELTVTGMLSQDGGSTPAWTKQVTAP